MPIWVFCLTGFDSELLLSLQNLAVLQNGYYVIFALAENTTSPVTWWGRKWVWLPQRSVPSRGGAPTGVHSSHFCSLPVTGCG